MKWRGSRICYKEWPQQYYDDPTRENVGTKEVEKAGTMKNFKQLQSSTIVGKDDPLKAYSWIIDMDILLRTGMIWVITEWN